MEEKKNLIVDTATRLLAQRWPEATPFITSIFLMEGDGSQRYFYRLQLSNYLSVIAVLPGWDSQLGSSEAHSAWHISRHLFKKGVPVPEPLAYDDSSHLILFEDLGDTRLYDLLKRDGGLRDDQLFSLYRNVIKELVRMQVNGKENFDPAWCWQTSRYDRQLMLERESGYFLQSLCREHFSLDPDPDILLPEFEEIAGRAALAPADYFLHRDFQSRNIMIKDEAVRIIDFQGGRLGPLGYDLASLLIDPYTGISPELQETLYDEYVYELLKKVGYDPLALREEYHYLALQRNLQILGAFAFLAGQRNKTYFAAFIKPALLSMRALLAREERGNYPVLAGLIETCLENTE